MFKFRCVGLLPALLVTLAGCGSDASTTGSSGGTTGTTGNGGAVSSGGTSGSGGTSSSGGATPTGSGGSSTGGTNGTGGSTPNSGGASSSGGASGSGGAVSSGGSGTTGGTSSSGGASGSGGSGGSSGTSLTGTLGALGSVKPTVAGFVVSNSGETLIYLSSAPLTCEMMQTQGTPWLSKVAAGAQVIEIVVKGAPQVKSYNVGFLGAEVNYAEGGKSSSYEVNADSGSVSFTEAAANGPVTGTVTATYPSGNLTGTFHAEFCANASQY